MLVAWEDPSPTHAGTGTLPACNLTRAYPYRRRTVHPATAEHAQVQRRLDVVKEGENGLTREKLPWSSASRAPAARVAARRLRLAGSVELARVGQ